MKLRMQFPRLLGTRWVASAEREKTRIILIATYIFIYVFSLQVSETQTYYAGGLQTPSKSILTLLPGYIALKLYIYVIDLVYLNAGGL